METIDKGAEWDREEAACNEEVRITCRQAGAPYLENRIQLIFSDQDDQELLLLSWDTVESRGKIQISKAQWMTLGLKERWHTVIKATCKIVLLLNLHSDINRVLEARLGKRVCSGKAHQSKKQPSTFVLRDLSSDQWVEK